MTQRTCNIILACKGKLYGDTIGMPTRVAKYMSEECACDIEAYTEDVLEGIMLTALYDYVDSCDRPSGVLHDIFQPNIKYSSLTAQICSALALVRVRNNDGSYVNGFKEEYIANAVKTNAIRNEEKFIELINKARDYVKGELELELFNDEWYARDYREESGCLFSIDIDGFDKPLITVREAKVRGIDVVKCCNRCNVYHSS